METNSQLIKKIKEGGYNNVYPIAYIDGIIDKESNEKLSDILIRYNNIMVPWQGDVASTRNRVPSLMRRQGIVITYITDLSEIVTEVYKGTVEDIKNNWADNINWELVPDLKFVQDNASKLPDGTITPEKLSPALQELISQSGSVVNMPDDEDLEQKDMVLKFKDRPYNSELASGKGYKILRKNWTKVGTKTINLLTQEMINKPNTIYEIRYDYNLNGNTVTIPEGCILDMRGGSVTNGTINCVDTIIISTDASKLDVTLTGTYRFDSEKLVTLNTEDINISQSVDRKSHTISAMLADRDTTNGMGYVILRKDKSFEEQVIQENTIYEIRYDFDLNGAEITVPTNCIFEFNGGSVSGSGSGSNIITFTNTLLSKNIKFLNVVATGTIANNSITPKDFGALGDGVTNDTVAFKSAINICNNIHVTAGTYILSLGSNNDPKLRCIFIDRSNVHIKMDNDAVLKADETALEELSYFRTMIVVEGPGVVNNTDTRIENITIEGGKIIGSRSQYNLPDITNRGENYCGIAIRFCNNVTIKNCIITDCAGDCIYTAAVDNLRVENVTGLRFRRAAVSVGLDNGVLIKGCTFDKPAPITYDNGNTSSGTSAPYTICFEPEPASLRKISDKPIQNVIIEDNTFIGDATFTKGLYIEGCVSGITIRKNIFKNARKYNIILQSFSNYGSNGICENALIEENTIEGIVYSEGTKANNASIDAKCNGNITIRNNKVSNMALIDASEYTTLIIENNETTGWECFARIDSNIEDFTPKVYIKGNISEATCILSILGNNVQDIYINDNMLSGSATIIDGTESFCDIIYNPSNVYIENNKATIHGRFIVRKRFDNTGKLLLKGNYFDCYPTDLFLVFDVNGNKRYVNADIINNYIRTTVNGTLSVKDFTGKMSVINNVFAGAETKFTEDDTDTDHLKINNNVYIE